MNPGGFATHSRVLSWLLLVVLFVCPMNSRAETPVPQTVAGSLLNQYYDIGRWSKWGLWGVLEHVTQDPTTSPKYQGLLDAIAAHPARPR